MQVAGPARSGDPVTFAAIVWTERNGSERVRYIQLDLSDGGTLVDPSAGADVPTSGAIAGTWREVDWTLLAHDGLLVWHLTGTGTIDGLGASSQPLQATVFSAEGPPTTALLTHLSGEYDEILADVDYIDAGNLYGPDHGLPGWLLLSIEKGNGSSYYDLIAAWLPADGSTPEIIQIDNWVEDTTRTNAWKETLQSRISRDGEHIYAIWQQDHIREPNSIGASVFARVIDTSELATSLEAAIIGGVGDDAATVLNPTDPSSTWAGDHVLAPHMANGYQYFDEGLQAQADEFPVYFRHTQDGVNTRYLALVTHTSDTVSVELVTLPWDTDNTATVEGGLIPIDSGVADDLSAHLVVGSIGTSLPIGTVVHRTAVGTSHDGLDPLAVTSRIQWVIGPSNGGAVAQHVVVGLEGGTHYQARAYDHGAYAPPLDSDPQRIASFSMHRLYGALGSNRTWVLGWGANGLYLHRYVTTDGWMADDIRVEDNSPQVRAVGMWGPTTNLPEMPEKGPICWVVGSASPYELLCTTLWYER